MSAGASKVAAEIAAAGVARYPTARQTLRGHGCGGTRRLIFINRYFFPDLSATSQMLSDLVRSLSADGFELHVICSRQLYLDPRSRLMSREFAAGANIHRCWSTRFGRSRLAGRSLDYATFLFTAALRLARLSRRGDIVVALTDPPMISVVAAAVARVRGASLINWLQDVFPEIALALGVVRLPAWAATGLLRLRNWALRVACRNVVLGSSMGRLIRARGIPSLAVRVIENWADADGLMPCPSQRSSLRRSLCADGRFVIQYSGNLGRAHEYETLLGAALELRAEEHWLFLFVGDGANMRLLRSKAEQAGLQNMRFLPLQPREDLADCLAAADVHVASLLPTLEGLIVPSKLYGILAAGRPVIVIGDPDGEQARVVRGARCGSVIRCGDSAGLADELRRMRGEAEWLREAGNNARHLFERRYTLTAAAGKWRKMLADMDPSPYGR